MMHAYPRATPPASHLMTTMADNGETEQNRRGRQFLEDRRLNLGVQWSEIARDMVRLHGVSISADYLYKIKRGASPLARMSVDAREALRMVLGISAEEWTEETGLYSPTATPITQHRASAAALGYKIPRPAPRPIDPALQKAADEYGDKTELAPIREYRWLRTLNDIPFKRRPVTPEEWLAVFLEHKDEWNPEEPDE